MRPIALVAMMLLPASLQAATKYLESGTDATRGLEFYTSTSGTVASATDQSHTGPRAIKLSTGSPATAATAQINAVLADAGRRTNVWFRCDTWGGTPHILRFNDTSGNNIIAIQRLNSGATGALSIVPGGATTVNGTTVVTTNTWNRLTVSYTITNTTTFQIRMYLNGVLEATATAGTLTRTGTSALVLVAGSTLGANANCWFDDLYVDDGTDYADPGNILVTAKRPTANGTLNQFTTQVGAGGSGYGSGHAQQVNEQPLSTTNGWSVIGAGSTSTEEFTIEGQTVGDVDLTGTGIIDIAGWIYSSAALAETGQIVLNGATSNVALTTTNTLFLAYAGSTSYPAGTGTDIGEVTDTTVTTVRLYECGILIAYQPHGKRLLLFGVG